MTDHDDTHMERILSQSEARKQAQVLTEQGTPAIAVPVPARSWGGTEQGWTVEYLPPSEESP